MSQKIQDDLGDPQHPPPRTSSLVPETTPPDVPPPPLPARPVNPLPSPPKTDEELAIGEDLLFAYIGLVWLLADMEEEGLAKLLQVELSRRELGEEILEEDAEQLSEHEKSSEDIGPLADEALTARLNSPKSPHDGQEKHLVQSSEREAPPPKSPMGIWQSFTKVIGLDQKDSKDAVQAHPAVESYKQWRTQLLHGLTSANGLKGKEVEIIEGLPLHGVKIESLVQSFTTSFHYTLNQDKIKQSSETPVLSASSDSRKHDAVNLILSNIIFSSLQETVLQSRELRYDSRLRSILRHVAGHIWTAVFGEDGVVEDSSKARGLLLQQVEHSVANRLQEEASAGKGQQNQSEQGGYTAGAPSEESGDRWKRWAGVGLATIGGGVVIGLTGGLAAPLIGAGLGSMLSGLGLAAHVGLCTTLGTTAGAAFLGTLFGVTGGGLSAYRFNRRMGALTTFAFHSLNGPQNNARPTKGEHLHLTIPISGWLEKESDITDPWSILPAYAPFSEVTALEFDPHHLLTLGSAFQDFMKSSAVTYGTTAVLKQTMLSGLLSALVWPIGLLQLGYLVDNPWSIGLDRARKAGLVLAKDVLSKFVQGKRPVTLVGWSLGARAIFYCLLELARNNCYGIVDEAYLFGTPVGLNPHEWRLACTVVSGRIVNGFSKADWFLSYLYRTTQVKNGVAGLRRIRLGLNDNPNDGDEANIENVDLSHIVNGHLKYRECLPDILDCVGFERGRAATTQGIGLGKHESGYEDAGQEERTLLWAAGPNSEEKEKDHDLSPPQAV